MLKGKSILLIVSGGIAAYKSPLIVRGLQEHGATVRCVLTEGGSAFVTPLTLSALSGNPVYRDLFSLTDEAEMGHIRLAREADLILIAPATAHLLAKAAQGLADDLASTILLATDKPVMAAPAMNVTMWESPATQDNVTTLAGRGLRFLGPETGELACHENGPGRMTEPQAIIKAVVTFFKDGSRLKGRHALVTSGPTFEAIDPVRFLGNRSSGKQGHAIAEALARLGAATTLVSGPTQRPDPEGVKVVRVETAREMLAACERALPADIAVCAAAVSDWRPAERAMKKIKKNAEKQPPAFALVENPDILATLSRPGNRRPRLVVGFAAETDNLIENANNKLAAKGCDWIVANDVSSVRGTFGGDRNKVHLITEAGIEEWPDMTKAAVARRLSARIAECLHGAGGGPS